MSVDPDRVLPLAIFNSESTLTSRLLIIPESLTTIPLPVLLAIETCAFVSVTAPFSESIALALFKTIPEEFIGKATVPLPSNDNR